jgi:tetratricopeptide (TPR) repeat protein
MRRLRYILALCVVLSATIVFAQQQELQLANHYFNNGEYDKSAEIYEQLFAKNPDDFNYHRLTECLIRQKQYSEAEKVVKKRLKQRPDDASIYVDWGWIAENNGKRKQAEKHYSTAIEKAGYNKSIIDKVAEAFENIGHPQQAIQTYQSAGERLRNPYAYTFEMAQLYEKNGDYQKMIELYFGYLDKYPFASGQIQLMLQQQAQGDNAEFDRCLKNTIARHIADNPQNQTYHDMMIWFSLQKKDFDFAMSQAKAIDKRFADDHGTQVFRVSQIAASNQALTTAIEGYDYLLKKGTDNDYYFESYVGLLSAKFDQIGTQHSPSQKQLDALCAEYESAIATLGSNTRTVPLLRNYAQLMALYKNNSDKATEILYGILDMPAVAPKQKAETKLQLGDILLFSGSVWEASLLYMQVEKDFKNDLIGSQAKYKNAQLSYYNADFEWAKSQLDVLRASTSKPIANDAMQLSLLISDNMDEDSTYTMLAYFAKGDMLLYQKKYTEACQYYDSVCVRNMSHPLFDEILMRKAQIALQQGNYPLADSLLQNVVQLYPADILADDALFLLATINEEQLGNPSKALEYYEKIILDYPASLYIAESRKKYNMLKNKNTET